MTTLQAAAQNQLRQFVEQIERLEEEKPTSATSIWRRRPWAST